MLTFSFCFGVRSPWRMIATTHRSSSRCGPFKEVVTHFCLTSDTPSTTELLADWHKDAGSEVRLFGNSLTGNALVESNGGKDGSVLTDNARSSPSSTHHIPLLTLLQELQLLIEPEMKNSLRWQLGPPPVVPVRLGAFEPRETGWCLVYCCPRDCRHHQYYSSSSQADPASRTS